LACRTNDEENAMRVSLIGPVMQTPALSRQWKPVDRNRPGTRTKFHRRRRPLGKGVTA
jgi:hypothetical protein